MLKKKSLFESFYFWVIIIIILAVLTEYARGYEYKFNIQNQSISLNMDSINFGQGTISYDVIQNENYIKPRWIYTFNNPKNINFQYNLKSTSPIWKKINNGYQISNTTWRYLPIWECILYNSTQGVIDQFLFHPVNQSVSLVNQFSYNINLKGYDVKSIECSDPLINNATPILTFLSPDGITSEDGNYTTWLQNNPIQNFSIVYHVARTVSNISSYDSITDGWIIGGRSCGTGNNVVLAMNFTKGIVLSCGGYTDDLQLCDDTNFVGSNTAQVNNNSGPVFNITFIPNFNASAPINATTNIEWCNVTSPNRVYGRNETNWAWINISSTGLNYGGIAIENNTMMKYETINARLVYLPVGDMNFKSWRNWFRDLSIHAFKWAIIEPTQFQEGCNSQFANTSIIWTNLTECSIDDEVSQVGNYTTYDIYSCVPNITYNISAINYCNYCLNSNLSICQSGGITEGDENMIAIVILYGIFMVLGYYMIRTANWQVGWGLFLISYLFDFFIMGQLYKEYSADLVVGITGQLTWIFFVGFFAWIAIKSISLISLRVRRT